MTRSDPLRLLMRHPLSRQIRAAAGDRPSHLVGGTLRDALLRLDRHDLDVVVGGGGEVISERLAATLPARLVRLGGDRFASYRLVGDGFQIDLWDRGENNLAADLARRDFTVNSIALDLADGGIVDPHRGRDDLGDRRLRATTAGAFVDDPLRILRLVRFAGPPWNLHPDGATLDLARAAVDDLSRVAAERQREELGAAMRAGEARPAVALLARLDLLRRLFDLPAETADRLAAEAAGAIDRLERCLVRRREILGGEASPPELALARWAALASASERGGGQMAAESIRSARRQGLVSTREATAVTRLLAAGEPPTATPARRRFLHAAGRSWSIAVCVAAARTEDGAQSCEGALAALAELARRDGAAIFAPQPLLDGHEIARELGIAPGPRLGRLIESLEAAQVEGRVATREEALRHLRAAAGAS